MVLDDLLEYAISHTVGTVYVCYRNEFPPFHDVHRRNIVPATKCYRVSPQPGEWLTFYLMAERSNSLTTWRRLGQVVGSIPRCVPFFIFFLFFPKKEI